MFSIELYTDDVCVSPAGKLVLEFYEAELSPLSEAHIESCIEDLEPAS